MILTEKADLIDDFAQLQHAPRNPQARPTNRWRLRYYTRILSCVGTLKKSLFGCFAPF